MATVHVVVGKGTGKADGGGVLPVIDAVPASKQTITSSGTNQASTAVVPAGRDPYVWEITVTGGNVWVRFGAAPVAAAGSDHLILNGQTRNFVGVAGHKVGIIDAA